MWTCPNCHHTEEFPTICSQCLFDGSSDALRYPTLISLAGHPCRPTPPATPKPARTQNKASKPQSPAQGTVSSTSPVSNAQPTPADKPSISQPIVQAAPSAPTAPKPTAAASSAVPVPAPKRTFPRRAAAVLVGAMLCIGGAVLALRLQPASLPAASLVSSSAADSAAADISGSAASSDLAESSSAANASDAKVSPEVLAFRNSRTAQYFSDETYYMESKCTSTTTLEGTPFHNSYQQISARYQGMTYSKAIISNQAIISISRDGFTYNIYPDQKLILKSDASSEESTANFSAIEQALTDGSLVLTTSTKTIDGTSYYAETLSGNLSETVQSGSASYTGTETFCFDGDTLCYMLIDDEVDGQPSSTQMEITLYSHNVDQSLFELPDYKIYTCSASGEYYDENGKPLDYSSLL